ncbi:hypothetical protein IDG99_00900 [Pelagibacterales bacterium SAG-MED09]|nr:hypothetical protein [Pelagibacterales bacterium SAG-MED09]
MKKLLLSIVFSVLYVLPTSADMGINVGVSGSAGVFTASADETFTPASTENRNQNGSEHGEAGWGSIFGEISMNRAFIGIDYVPSSLETETAETAKSDKQTTGSDAVTEGDNIIQIDFEDLTTYYVGAMVTDNLYVKAGITTVDVITNESLATGGSYGNVSLDGSMFGVGYHLANSNGAFLRVEGNYMSFDGATQTNSDDNEKSIRLKNLDGVSGKISVGKSF